MTILVAEDITKCFDGLVAVDNVNLKIKRNSITALIGPNGAGKTTFFNILTGVYKPDSGSITFDNELISCKKPHQITTLGIARTFQNIRLFNQMSVLENVMVGMHTKLHENIFKVLFSLKKNENMAESQAYSLLKYVGIEEYINHAAQDLPYGAQKKLEIARALAIQPKLLLLDEPAAGMNPKETETLTNLISQIRSELDITILLIEHDMKLIMNISEEIFVLDHGKNIANGTPEAIKCNPNVIEAYLGKELIEN